MQEFTISYPDEKTHPKASAPPGNHSGACAPGAHAGRRRRHGAGGRNRIMHGDVHLASRHPATSGRVSLLSPVRGSPG